MVQTLLILTLTHLFHVGHYQDADASLLVRLSGSVIDEGHYKPVAYVTFYEFDSKCRQRQSGKIKLNKKIRSVTRSLPVGKPVIVFVYYGDLKASYGRSTGDYLVFNLETGKKYSFEIKVEGSRVSTEVHEQVNDTEGKSIPVQRGFKYVQCG